MKIPIESVKRMKREFRDAGSLYRTARRCGLPMRNTQADRYWRGDFRDVEGVESFLLMIGLRVKLEKV